MPFPVGIFSWIEYRRCVLATIVVRAGDGKPSSIERPTPRNSAARKTSSPAPPPPDPGEQAPPPRPAEGGDQDAEEPPLAHAVTAASRRMTARRSRPANRVQRLGLETTRTS